MKKISLLLVSVLTLLSSCFTSCENSSVDALKGTWKGDPGYNSSSTGGTEILEMTIVFDGKGNFTSTVVDYYEKRVAVGTYIIDGNLVHLFYSMTNGEGITKDYKTDMEIDWISNPPTLISYVYDQYGNLLQIILYEKQS